MASTVATAGAPTRGGPAGTKKSQSTMVHHRLRHQQPIDPEIASVFLTQDSEVVRAQLDRALALALEAVGFDEADPLAMESFRALVEEYMEHFLQTVHRSMLASRRRTPVPLDFQTALAANNLTLRSLSPHLDPPVHDASKPRHPVLPSSTDILPALSSRPASDEPGSEDTAAVARATAKQEAVLGKILSSGGLLGGGETSTAASAGSGGGGQQQQQRPANVPRGFPALPSQHTYRSRAVFAVREKNPQRIRELASEEGRLGEEALRRLASKQAELRRAREEREKKESGVSGEQTGMTTTGGMDGVVENAKGTGIGAATTTSSAEAVSSSSRKKRKANAPLFRAQADGMFKDLMASVAGSAAGDEAALAVAAAAAAATESDRDWNGGLNEPVNSERIYWRQAPKRPVANG